MTLRLLAAGAHHPARAFWAGISTLKLQTMDPFRACLRNASLRVARAVTVLISYAIGT